MDSIAWKIRKARPALGRKADHEGSRASAVHLKCLDCCAGQRAEVEACMVYACPLWPHRPYKSADTRPAGSVPTVEQYDAWSAERPTPTGASAHAFGRISSGENAGEDDGE